MHYRFESIKIEKSQIHISGFIAGESPESDFSVSVVDSKGKEIPFELKRLVRNDVSAKYFRAPSDVLHGISLSFKYTRGRNYCLIVDIDQKRKKISINPFTVTCHRTMMSLRSNAFLQSVKSRIKGQKPAADYQKWAEMHRPGREELERQRNMVLEEKAPLFSVVIPLYRTPEKYLRELIGSIQKQTYRKFEICFADGSQDHSDLEKIIQEYQKSDRRIRYRKLDRNRGISGNTNAALEMAAGDFIVLCDHDDLLTEDALFELTEAIRNNPECDCIYSDEDKVDETSEKYFEPYFKPDYNIDLLCSNNYICHLYAVRKSIVEKTGGFREEFDGAQDHDFILRTTEEARKTVHIPKVLYHWRTHLDSTSSNPESKLYAFEAGKKAVRAHYERVWPQLKIERIEDGISLGIYHTVFDVSEELVSIIIPNKDHIDYLDRALRSVIEKSTWKNLEFIVVENNSEDEKTFEYYEKIQNEYPQVKVIRYEDEFNYSAINNFAAEHAHGQYLLLMNNDVELINPDSIKEMMGYCQRDDVGIVGCRLLYEDNTIQHAGVVVGIGVAEHILKNTVSGDGTYHNRAMIAQDMSAVTAAVMLTKKELYTSLGGLDETYKVAFNDIDYCLRVREAGKLVVYNPYANFYHYESKTRGQDNTPEKMSRYMNELERFTDKWKEYYINGDPMYNTNLTHDDGSCSLSKV